MRVMGAFFDYEFNPLVSGSSPLTLAIDRPMPLYELAKADRLITALAGKPGEATMNLQMQGDMPPLTLQLLVTPSSTLNYATSTVINQAVKIVNRIGATIQSRVVFADLLQYHKSLDMLDKMTSDEGGSVRVTFARDSDVQVESGDSIVCVGLCAAPIGDSLYVAVILVFGDVDTDKSGLQSMTTNSWRVEKTLMLDRNAIDWDALDKEMRDASHAYEEEFKVLLLLDRPAD